MAIYRYETHKFPNPLLPFIFHPRMERTTASEPANWHGNIELLRCIEGSGYIRESAETYPLTPGSIHIINSDILHSFGSQNRVVYQCLIIDNSFFIQNGIPIETLHFQNRIHDPRVLSLFEEVSEAYRHSDSGNYLDILTLRIRILRLVQALCRSYTADKPESHAPGSVKKAILYLRDHLDQPIILDTLAHHVGISKYHLVRQFKQYTGSTVIQTLNRMRCTQAQRLIVEGMRVSDAARDCGFENLSYFSRTYRSIFGHAPSET